MRTTIDSGGRVVIPKALRERFHMAAGSSVELVEAASGIVISPVNGDVAIVERDGALVAETPAGFVITNDDVLAIRDALRR